MLDYKIVEWKEVAEKISQVRPEFAEVINEYNLDSYPLIQARYPYGSHLIKDGDFKISDKNSNLVSFRKSGCHKEIESLLNYNWKSIPFGLVTKGTAESYWHSSRHIPVGVLQLGANCALRTVLDTRFYYNFHKVYNLSSGVKLIFLLASLKDKNKFKKLNKHYGFRCIPPETPFHHWELFREIFNKENNNWHTEFTFFTKPWLDDIFSGKLNNLKLRMFEVVWKSLEFDRNLKNFDFVWDEFIKTVEKRGIKNKEYIYHLARHLVLIAIGHSFGFSPIDNDQNSPISLFKKVFCDVYKLTYEPIFMSVKKLDWQKDEDSIFSSLQIPTLYMSGITKRSTNVSSKDDLREIKYIIDLFYEGLLQKNSELFCDTRFELMPRRIKFEYFHVEKDKLHNINERNGIKFDNINVSYNNINYSHPFFNGCVKICYKKCD